MFIFTDFDDATYVFKRFIKTLGVIITSIS